MPLEERVLQPICVSSGIIDDHKSIYNLIPNELECFTNGTLANVIKQLSSLSLFAEDLFGSILTDTNDLFNRTSTLRQKLDDLAVKVTQLDCTNEDISLHDIHLKKPYKPQNTTVQEIFSKKTMPKSVQELYHECSKPPPLYLLNQFREDGKDGMKFYTNPNFFFELWRDDMLRKEKEKNNKKLAHRPSNKLQNGLIQDGKKPRQPANSNERYRKMVSQQEFLIGDDLPNRNVIYMPNNEVNYDQYGTIRQNNQANVYGTYNNGTTVNQQQIQQQQQHYSYHNGIPQHLQQQQQINGNANYINQMNSITPPPSYQQVHPSNNNAQHHQFNQQQQQQELYNQQQVQQNHMQTLTRRSRPSQPPPEPPMANGHLNSSYNEYHQTNGYVNHYSQSNVNSNNQMNGHHPNSSHNEYHQTNGYVNHYSQSNINVHHQQQANLNNSSNNNELVNVKRPQSIPPPVPNMNNNSNNTNGSINSNMPVPPPMPINVNGKLVNPTNHQPQPPPIANIPPPPPPMPSLLPAQPSSDVTDNVKSNNSNNSLINNKLPFNESSFEQEILQKQKQLQPVKNVKRPPPKSDPRNDLLAAIREGIQLRKVENSKQKEVEKPENLSDVASILARRVALELSDSDSNDSDGSSNADWEDESHV